MANYFVYWCETGNLAELKTAIENGADVNQGNSFETSQGARTSFTGLMAAAWFRHMDVAELLLRQPAIDVNFVGESNNNSALSVAVLYGNPEMTALLLAREDLTRAIINHRNHRGHTPLMVAID